MLELLQNTDSHPTAAWLYDRLKGEFPGLSMGTVYRNLNILIDMGLVNKLDFGSTFDRFEAQIGPHYHFVCEKCNMMTDLKIPIDHELNERVSKTTNFTVFRHRIEYFGLCDKCAHDAANTSH